MRRLLLCTIILPLSGLELAQGDPWIRPGLPWWGAYTLDPSTESLLEVRLLRAAQILQTQQVRVSPSSARSGPTLVPLLLPEGRGDSSVQILALTRDAQGTMVNQLSSEIPTPIALRAQIAAQEPGEHTPLRQLRRRQASALSRDQARLGELIRASALLSWLRGDKADPEATERALRCPLDGSPQPWRAHGPDSAPRHILALEAANPSDSAIDWGHTQYLPDLVAAGYQVQELFTAGDQDLSGAAAARAQALCAEQGAPWAIATRATATRGALRIARAVGARALLIWEAPDDLRAEDDLPLLILDQGPLPRGAERCAVADLAQRLDRLAARTPQRNATLFPPWTGVFSVVIGSGEHRAARAANQTLSETFIRAWIAHAQSLPCVQFDRDTSTLPDGDLLCLGNPRSNSVLSAWADQLPLRWDERDVWQEQQPYLRDTHGVWLNLPRPDGKPGRLCILDGEAAASLIRQDGGAPLADLGEQRLVGP